jgi:hypothetical protein
VCDKRAPKTVDGRTTDRAGSRSVALDRYELRDADTEREAIRSKLSLDFGAPGKPG